ALELDGGVEKGPAAGAERARLPDRGTATKGDLGDRGELLDGASQSRESIPEVAAEPDEEPHGAAGPSLGPSSALARPAPRVSATPAWASTMPSKGTCKASTTTRGSPL